MLLRHLPVWALGAPAIAPPLLMVLSRRGPAGRPVPTDSTLLADVRWLALTTSLVMCILSVMVVSGAVSRVTGSVVTLTKATFI
jgi:hypothetical protein